MPVDTLASNDKSKRTEHQGKGRCRRSLGGESDCLSHYVGPAPFIGPTFALEHLKQRDVLFRQRITLNRLQVHRRRSARSCRFDVLGAELVRISHGAA